jgi:hypothetical protein
MADVICRICGEPWDTWGVETGEGDLTREEYRELIAGEGCPACGGEPPCANCWHPKRRHESVLRKGDRRCTVVETVGLAFHSNGWVKEQCPCTEYAPKVGDDHTEDHFGSIEGEDAEAWETLM